MRAWALWIAWSVCGCTASDPIAAADYSPKGAEPANLTSCDMLRGLDADVNGLGRFVVDGGPAGCAPEGIECSLGACDGGSAAAICYLEQWASVCVGAMDGADSSDGESANQD